MYRKEIYRAWVCEAVKKILASQSKNGKFFVKCGAEQKFSNARLQEAVLTLAQEYFVTKDQTLLSSINKGISFWAGLQHKDGSFPEYCKEDRSLSATAFSTAAVARTIKLLNLRGWREQLERAGGWLLKNDEIALTNQEAAAALALLEIHCILGDKTFLDGACKKLSIIFENQAEEGYYSEKNGFDLGYSSLTLELLGQCFTIEHNDDVLRSASKFIDFVRTLPEKLENSRKTDWVVVGGFEFFADKVSNGAAALELILRRFNVEHLEREINYFTDAYRLQRAAENSNVAMLIMPKREKIIRPPIPRNKLFDVLRPFGIHKFRAVLK